MLDANDPKYKEVFDRLGMPEDQRQDWLWDLEGIIGQILDGYFRELADSKRPDPAPDTPGGSPTAGPSR